MSSTSQEKKATRYIIYSLASNQFQLANGSYIVTLSFKMNVNTMQKAKTSS